MHAEIIRVKSLLIALLYLASFQAHATLTIQSAGGVSHFEQDLTNNNFTIYGGMAGTCASTDGATTCNSCTNTNVGPAIQACNLKNVYPTLPISITFTSDQAFTNVRYKITTEEQMLTTPAVEYSITNPYLSASAGASMTVSVKWSYLCAHDTAFSMAEACTPTGVDTGFANPARKIYLWVDEDGNGTESDGEKKSIDVKLHYIKADDATVTTQPFCTAPSVSAVGLCGYKLGIGDSKFYIQELFGADSAGAGTAPPKSSANSPDWYGLVFIPAPVADISQISNASGIQIRPYDATYGIPDNTVTGLTNYSNYCMLMGNINKSQNIYKFALTGATTNDTCGQPSEVIGMLSDKSCFISTAAFGSDMADQVQLLRQFRNEFLLTNSYGKKFVKAYYKLSPPVAHFIENSEILKSMTRTALYPFIAMAWLAVNYGILPAALLVLFIFSSLYFVVKRRRAVHA